MLSYHAIFINLQDKRYVLEQIDKQFQACLKTREVVNDDNEFSLMQSIFKSKLFWNEKKNLHLQKTYLLTITTIGLKPGLLDPAQGANIYFCLNNNLLKKFEYQWYEW